METVKRESGILLPVSSIPSRYGIGTFGSAAYRWIDFLAAAGQRWWQVLPMGPTSYGDSPYQSFSTFAGNPYFIDFEMFLEKGWLTAAECDGVDFGGCASYVDYERQYKERYPLLRTAFSRSRIGEWEEYRAFTERNRSWLEDYALFMALKEQHGGASWQEWPQPLKRREPQALKQAREALAEDVAFWKFIQFIFFYQWNYLKAYAIQKNVRIIGDLPIYVALDSADVWANPALFQLDEMLEPTFVAGCPPDAFSATGQLWGNPLYEWDVHEKRGYDWWIARVKAAFALFDKVRIDHFRGFDAYWAVPFGDSTAEKGSWRKGPGMKLFDRVRETLGEPAIIAEDLGILTDSVYDLLNRSGYPGMKVLQFAFSGGDNDYLPHHHTVNSVVYTGTQDNDTTAGWFASLHEKEQSYVLEFLGAPRERLTERLIAAALESVSQLCVIPMQDWLGLGGEARMNTPSTLGENWKWRLTPEQLSPALSDRIRHMTELYQRL